MMTTDYHCTRSVATCARYICFAKLLIKSMEELPVLERLSAGTDTVKGLHIYTIWVAMFFIVSNDEDTLIMVEVREYFVNNPTKVIALRDLRFYDAANAC